MSGSFRGVQPRWRLSRCGRLLSVDSAGQQTSRASPAPLAIVFRGDARGGQRAADDGQHRRRPWSVALATLVSFSGEGGQVAGVLQFFQQSSASSSSELLHGKLTTNDGTFVGTSCIYRLYTAFFLAVRVLSPYQLMEPALRAFSLLEFGASSGPQSPLLASPDTRVQDGKRHPSHALLRHSLCRDR